MTDPGRYANERLAKVSIGVIAFSMALSRVLLLIQYLRVLGYAHWTVKHSGGTVPGKLYVIPIGLCVSTPLFFAAWGVSRAPYGSTPHGAKVKFYLWGFGLLVEGASHLRITRLRWLRRWIKSRIRRSANHTLPGSSKPGLGADSRRNQSGTLVMPQSDVRARSRLEAITTIILGEGINGIAGTLYSVVSAPTLGGPIVSNVTCAAFIVCFLAYLYFEGPTGSQELKARGRRRVCWVVLHFPFLLCVILLLQGVKNQFLLTSYLSSAKASYKDLYTVFAQQNLTIGGPDVADNLVAKNYFLERGLSWKLEYTTLMNRLTQNGTVPLGQSTQNQTNEWYAWNMRLAFKIQIQAYKTFTPGGNITQSIQAQIDEYNTNLTYPLQDWNNTSGSLGSLHFYQILTELLSSNLETARYIVALAGLILIFMAILDLSHSRPQDRYQWGAIMARFTMGWLLILLLLLNLGRYQSLWVYDNQHKHQAGVFLWLSAYWVLPTIAIAYGIQCAVETVLVRLAANKYKMPIGGLEEAAHM
ncbi:hypothetical protein FRC08_009845 [Ceratobasidium sp. 394]|nr:hypothetical protein FRC08_009845 [Ceratobasidium sp. 394]